MRQWLSRTDAELHEVVVDRATTRLDDEDILATDRVLDLAASLAARELAEDAVAQGDAEHVAYAVGQLRVRVAREHDNVADHGGILAVCSKGERLSVGKAPQRGLVTKDRRAAVQAQAGV